MKFTTSIHANETILDRSKPDSFHILFFNSSGNKNDNCGTGVGFTRNPANGENVFYGEYLVNAQGEDVVAGIRTPDQLVKMKKHWPKIYDELVNIRGLLEKESLRALKLRGL